MNDSGGRDCDCNGGLRLAGWAVGGGCMAVSVTRADRPMQMKGAMRIPLKPKTHQAVEALARRAGWSVTKVVERPFGLDVILTK